LVQTAKKSESKIVSTIAKYSLPFIQTPTNILKQGIEYSPMGLATLWGNKNKSGQIAKIIFGTSAAVGVATLLGSERLSWGVPRDAKEKADFEAAGMQPYSIKVGNTWYSYAKIHPALAFNFALVSAIDDSKKRKGADDSMTDQILGSLAKWGTFFSDQSYMKTVGDLVAAGQGDDQSLSKIAGNYVSQAIPLRALLSWANNIADPVQRQADPNGDALNKQMQWIMAQLPGFSRMVPAKTDAAGNPILKTNRLWNAFSSIKESTGNEVGQAKYEQRVKSNVLFTGERKEQRQEATAQQTKAKAKYKELAAMSPEDANAELEKIKGSDKRMYNDLKALHTEVSKNFTVDEEGLNSLGIENGFRAQHIWEAMKAMPDKETKNAYMQTLEDKKLANQTVTAQLYAHQILEDTKDMKTAEEKNAYLDKLIAAGHMNATVEQELHRLTGK
jgi:hypothetical protein